MPHVHNGLHHYTQLLTAAARAMGEVSGSQDFTGIERFGETLTPTIDLFSLPEWALLRGEVLFRRADNSPAVAARFSTFQLVNPANSGVLAVVTHIESDGATPEFEVSCENGSAVGNITSTLRGVRCDSRYVAGEMSRCALTVADTATGSAIRQERIAGLGSSDQPWIIAPNGMLFIAALTVNTALSLGISWIERQILPTEQRA